MGCCTGHWSHLSIKQFNFRKKQVYSKNTCYKPKQSHKVVRHLDTEISASVDSPHGLHQEESDRLVGSLFAYCRPNTPVDPSQALNKFIQNSTFITFYRFQSHLLSDYCSRGVVQAPEPWLLFPLVSDQPHLHNSDLRDSCTLRNVCGVSGLLQASIVGGLI